MVEAAEKHDRSKKNILLQFLKLQLKVKDKMQTNIAKGSI